MLAAIVCGSRLSLSLSLSPSPAPSGKSCCPQVLLITVTALLGPLSRLLCLLG
jgi:hypothetical protein